MAPSCTRSRPATERAWAAIATSIALALSPALVVAVPVTASDAFVVSPAANVVLRGPPAATFGAGVYFVAWLEPGAGGTFLHGTMVTRGATLADTRVTGDFSTPIGTTSPSAQVSSAFDGTNFVAVVPTGDQNGGVYQIVKVDPGGTTINQMSATSPFVGSRIAIACGGVHCALAGATANDMGGVLALQPGNMAPTAFQHGLFDLPSIAWSGRDFRMSFDSIDTFAMDLSIVNATVDTAGTPFELGTDNGPIRGSRIACNPSNAVCFVSSDHDVPGVDVHGAIALADGSSPTGRFNYPDQTLGVARRSPDVGFHGPVFLVTWVDQDTSVTTNGIGANFYDERAGFTDPPVLIVPGSEQGDHPAIASTGAGRSIVAYTRALSGGAGTEIAVRFIPPFDCPPNCADGGDAGDVVDATMPDGNGAGDAMAPDLAVRYRGSGCDCSAAPSPRFSFAAFFAPLAIASVIAMRRRRRG